MYCQPVIGPKVVILDSIDHHLTQTVYTLSWCDDLLENQRLFYEFSNCFCNDFFSSNSLKFLARNLLKLSLEWFQSQLCAPNSSGAVIFGRFKNFDDYWQKIAQTTLLGDLKHVVYNYTNLLEWKKGQKWQNKFGRYTWENEFLLSNQHSEISPMFILFGARTAGK